MVGELQRAVALIRRDVGGYGVDVHSVAEYHGFRIVHTVRLDTGPLASVLIVAGAIMEYDAAAVVVPWFEHADQVRHTITEHSALLTPIRHYPRGYQWPVLEP